MNVLLLVVRIKIVWDTKIITGTIFVFRGCVVNTIDRTKKRVRQTVLPPRSSTRLTDQRIFPSLV